MKVTDTGVPVDALVGVVKEAVSRANVSPVSDLRVASVGLTLEVVASKAGGGGLSFQVPFIGMTLSGGIRVNSTDTHTIEITLVPPSGVAGRTVRGGDDVVEVLVEAITTVRAVMASAAGGDDPWVLSESTIDISFAVTRSGNISLGVQGELAGEVTQTLRLGLVPGTTAAG